MTGLSAGGRKADAGTPAVDSDGGWRFDLGAVPTVWYVVEVER